MLKTTPLNPLHREQGARMVEFAGWEMPLHYGSQIQEHHRVRSDAGMFDVSHMLAVDVSGAGARDYLRRMLANDVLKLCAPGAALYSCLLNEAGGIIDDLIVYLLEDHCFRLVVNAASAGKDQQWLERCARESGLDVKIAPRRNLAIIAVQGPNARSKVWDAVPGSQPATEDLKPFTGRAFRDLFITRTGYTGEDGFELLVPDARAAEIWRALQVSGVAPAGLGARDTLRLEAGLNLNGQDMDEGITPLECGLAWTVDLKSARSFIGKDALAGARPRRKRIGLVLLDKGVLRAHQKISGAHGDGETTSGGFSPTMNRSIALARVPLGVAPGERLRVEMRGKSLEAVAAEPPFVRQGRILFEEAP
jgi:glycine cleavage system T protein (aminomethyltransferase)